MQRLVFQEKAKLVRDRKDVESVRQSGLCTECLAVVSDYSATSKQCGNLSPERLTAVAFVMLFSQSANVISLTIGWQFWNVASVLQVHAGVCVF